MLSKKNATKIANLYNTIFVGELMCKSATAGPLSAEKNDTYKMWKKACVEAVNALKSEFGIDVIGY